MKISCADAPKRIAALILSLCAAVTLAITAFADNDEADSADPYAVPETSAAPYAYLYNIENDTVIYSKGSTSEHVIAGPTVKLMSGLVASEQLGDDLERQITITRAMLDEAEDAGGNSIGFYEGETVTAHQLLYGMLTNSANDATVLLAISVAGSVDSFVDLMNEKASSIGARATYYADPTGMDPSSVTTVADCATIAMSVYSDSTLMEVVGTPKYVMEATNKSDYRDIYNRNCLMSKHYRSDYYYDKAIGMNAGSTADGGYSSVTLARSSEGDLTYLCIILGSSTVASDTSSEKELTNYSYAIELFDWAFKTYGYRSVLTAGRVQCEIPVELSSTVDYVTLVPENEISVYMPMYADLEKDVMIKSDTEESVSAPVEKGQSLGTAHVIYNGQEIGSTSLCATADISRSEFLYALARIRMFAKSRFFVAAAVSAVVLSIGYVFMTAHLRRRRLRSRVQGRYRR